MKLIPLLLLTFHLAADWGTPFDLTTTTFPPALVITPQIATNSNGNAIAVWEFANEPDYNSIQATTYDITTNIWTPLSSISSTLSSSNASNPQVAINDNGQGLAVWELSPTVQAAIFDGTNWSAPVELPHSLTSTQTATIPQVGIDANGNAIAIWLLTDTSTNSTTIQTAKYDNTTTTWQMAISISTSEISPASVGAPQIKVNAAENAIAVWQENSQIMSATSTTALFTVWDVQTIPGTTAASNPQVAIDLTGNAVAVWEFTASNYASIQTATYTATAVMWSSITDISSTISPSSASKPQVAINGSDYVVAAWQVSPTAASVDTTTVQAAIFIGIWSAPTELPTPLTTTQTATIPQVGIDNEGNAIVVWLLTDTSTNSTAIQEATYTEGSATWGAPIFITPSVIAPASISGPQISVNPNSDAIAIWQQNTTNTNSEIIVGTGDTDQSTWTTYIIAGVTGATEPQIAVNPTGNAVAVWEVNNQILGSSFIQAATYDATTSLWSALVTIGTTSLSGITSNPQVTINDSGTAIAVWEVSPTNEMVDTTTVQAAIFDGTNWGAPTELPPSLTTRQTATTPQVGIDANGNAIAIWLSTDSFADATIIQGATYNGGAWNSPQNLTAVSAVLPGFMSIPQISVNAAGQAIAIWQQNSNINNSDIRTATYTTTSSGLWSALPAFGGPLGKTPQVGIDDAGNGVAIWINKPTAISGVVQAATLSFGGVSWNPTTPSNLTPISGLDAGITPQIKVTPDGDAVAIWHFQQGLTEDIIQAATLPFLGVWDLVTGANLSSNVVSGDTTDTPQVSVNANGHAMAVWQLNQATSQSIQSSFYNGTIWSAPSLVSDPLTSPNLPIIPQVGIDSANNAIAVWQLGEPFPSDFNIIQTNTFHLAPKPPTNFTGRSISNNFLTQTDLIDILSWDPSPDPSAVEYKLFQGRELVATIPKSGPFIITLHNRKNISYTYALIAYNAQGTPSTPTLYVTVP